MEIRISRRAAVRLLVILAWPMFILSVYGVGTRVTPFANGAPILLSPSIRDSIAYRRQALEWTRRLREIDVSLVNLQTTRQDVYEQTRQAEAVLASALQVAQEVELRRAPSALAGLRTWLLEASRRYYATAQAAAQWVGAPTPENGDAVSRALSEARVAMNALSASRWLAEEVQTPPIPPRSAQPTPTLDSLNLPSP